MADLFAYTKQIAQKIAYYNDIADFTEENHWLNPFYNNLDMTVIWVENEPSDDTWNK